jgi:hypothetical protein
LLVVEVVDTMMLLKLEELEVVPHKVILDMLVQVMLTMVWVLVTLQRIIIMQ